MNCNSVKSLELLSLYFCMFSRLAQCIFPPWRSRVPGCPALRSPATIITHTCFPHHEHQRFIALTWTQSLVLFLLLFLPVPRFSIDYHMSLCYPVLMFSVLFHVCAVLNVHSPYLSFISSIGYYSTLYLYLQFQP